MHTSLFVLGIVTAAAGFIAIGFGIPVNAFSLGNTLIMAGTTAVVGGFLLIGLAAVVRQLAHASEAGAMHATAMPMPSTDPFDVRAQYLGPQVSPGAAGLRPDHAPRPIAAEPKPGAAAGAAAEPDSAIAWLRPTSGEPTLGERAVIEEFEASLAPQQASPRPTPPPAMPRPAEPKAWTPLGTGDPAAETTTRSEPGSRSAPARGTGASFDTVWPDLRPSRSAESVERARKPEAPSPARDGARAAKDGVQPAAPSGATPDAQRPVAILKSGMIDGMAYTLYADGSIEAVLPTGPIRFASVDALRAHLDKSG